MAGGSPDAARWCPPGATAREHSPFKPFGHAPAGSQSRLGASSQAASRLAREAGCTQACAGAAPAPSDAGLAVAAAAPAGGLRASCAEIQALLGGCEDPHAELLAMVWGTRFDRVHALRLLARWHDAPPAVWHVVSAAAERFDALSAARQHRVRQLILRHRGRWHDNRPHAQAHSPD